MKRSILFGVVFSMALAVGVTAQSTGGQTSPPSGSADQVTVTGCLQSADAVGAGGATAGETMASDATKAARSGASRGGGFVLTNAKMASGTAGVSRFKLEGRQADLKKYADSRVEISGKLDKSMVSASSTTGSATSGATGAAGATGSGAAATGNAPAALQDVPTLRVGSVRQVSPTCSGG